MEEIFKGLIERAQYYEQFESYRNINPSYSLKIFLYLTKGSSNDYKTGLLATSLELLDSHNKKLRIKQLQIKNCESK